MRIRAVSRPRPGRCGTGQSRRRVGVAGHAALRRRHLLRTRRVTEPRPLHMHVAQIDLRRAGHSLQGVAARRRSRGDPAVDARLPETGTRAARDQRPLLPAVPVRGQDRVDHRPRRIRRPRLLGVRNTRAKLRARRLAPAINIDRDNHASIVHYDPRIRGRTARARESHALERRRRLVADRDQRRRSRCRRIATTIISTASSIRAGRTTTRTRRRGPMSTTARTAIGLSQDQRTLTLFTVDAGGLRASAGAGSEGMRLSEVANVLIRDFGVFDALNLDGGGSTTMAMEDPVTGSASIVNTRPTIRRAASWRRASRCSRSGVSAASDTPSTAPRRDRAGCPSRDSRRSGAGPTARSAWRPRPDHR